MQMIKPMNRRIFGALIQEPNKSTLILTTSDINKCRFLVKAVSDDIDDIGINETVLITKYAGTEVDFEGGMHLIVKYDDVIGIFEGV